MAIAYRSVATTVLASRTNITVNKPSGTADNDILIAAISVGGDVAVTPPTGWTLITTADETTVDLDWLIYWKRASSEGASWTWNHSTQYSAGVVAAISGAVTSGDPQDATAGIDNDDGFNTTANIPSVTTATNGSLVLAMTADYNTGVTGSTPSGWDERADVDGLKLWTKVQTTAGATGATSSTLSGTEYKCSAIVAIKEAGAGAIDLVVADTSVVTQVDAPVLTQTHSITVNDGACVTQSDAAVLTQLHVLSAADASVTTQTDSIILELGEVALVVADASVTTQVDAVVLTQTHNITVNDASCISQSDSITLTQLHVLTVADSSCTSQADAFSLVQLTVIRPTSDAYVGSWTNDIGGTTNLYQSIDETTANDADYIHSEGSPVSSPVVVALGTAADPLSSSDHTLRYRYQREGAGTVNLTVQLRQSYTNEGSPGTLIAEWTHSGIAASLVTAEQTLTGGQADSITDYAALYVRMVAAV